VPETKSAFLNKILEAKDADPDAAKSYSSERQHTAQAFSLQADYRDGMASEGVAWSQFARYRWADLGEHERLRAVFGPLCAIEILGHNLAVVQEEIREGKLNRIREMTTGERKAALQDGSKEPIILSVAFYPEFDKFFESVREAGEEHHEPGFAGKVKR